jgi:hypothetical protein
MMKSNSTREGRQVKEGGVSMKRNMGTIDRVVRAIIGIVVLGVGFGVLSGGAGIALGVIGAVLFATSLIRWCPLYVPFRFTTRKA